MYLSGRLGVDVLGKEGPIGKVVGEYRDEVGEIGLGLLMVGLR